MNEPILKLPLVTKRLGRSGATRSIIDANNVMLGTCDAITAREIAKMCNAHDALLAGLKRLVRANESDAEQCPTMDVLTAFETNSQALDQARKAIELAEKGQP